MNEPPGVDIPVKVRYAVSHDASGVPSRRGSKSHPRQNDFCQRLQLIRGDRRPVAARGDAGDEPEGRLPLPNIERMLQFPVRTIECFVADSCDGRVKQLRLDLDAVRRPGRLRLRPGEPLRIEVMKPQDDLSAAVSVIAAASTNSRRFMISPCLFDGLV
jgi:hypothetical protein